MDKTKQLALLENASDRLQDSIDDLKQAWDGYLDDSVDTLYEVLQNLESDIVLLHEEIRIDEVVKTLDGIIHKYSYEEFVKALIKWENPNISYSQASYNYIRFMDNDDETNILHETLMKE